MSAQLRTQLRALGVGSLFCLACASTAIASTASSKETILLFRHGEKPALGLGQLDCQGLNRALALPKVLLSNYGTPNYIFAPDPGTQINDSGTNYYYLRPLATIEPTAIQTGLPVNTAYGYTDIKDLQKTLLSSTYANSLVFVAWEHSEIVSLAQNIITKLGGNASVVPAWASTDFDSIYELTITVSGGATNVQFAHNYENLNNQSTTCPQ